LLLAETFAAKNLISELRVTNERLQRENEDFREEVKELKEKFERDSRRIKRDAENKIRDTVNECEEQIERAIGLMTLEINVCTAIKDILIDDNAV